MTNANTNNLINNKKPDFRIPNKAEYEQQINLTAQEISQRVTELGQEISHDYPDGVTLLINQKASIVFVADLMRAMDIETHLEFLELGSIKQQDDAAPLLYLRQSDELILNNMDCLICTDIVRTGFTIHFLLNQLQAKSPHSLEICTLLNNPRQQLLPFTLKYVGFETDYDSLCGYGIAYNGQGRNFPDIVQLIPAENSEHQDLYKELRQ